MGNRNSTQKRMSIVEENVSEIMESQTNFNEQNVDVRFNRSISQTSQIMAHENIPSTNNLVFNMILVLGTFLLLLHTYLCYKLYNIDQTILSPNIICLNQCKEGLLFYSL